MLTELTFLPKSGSTKLLHCTNIVQAGELDTYEMTVQMNMTLNRGSYIGGDTREIFQSRQSELATG